MFFWRKRCKELTRVRGTQTVAYPFVNNPSENKLLGTPEILKSEPFPVFWGASGRDVKEHVSSRAFLVSFDSKSQNRFIRNHFQQQ